ncbi:MAG: hypothetical protein COB49_05465 [Alphaproteobacteria bacterium]|nr:MAG: hypothetical protein COB49_05465 [Alphaproteobacteria bacterium]
MILYFQENNRGLESFCFNLTQFDVILFFCGSARPALRCSASDKGRNTPTEKQDDTAGRVLLRCG